MDGGYVKGVLAVLLLVAASPVAAQRRGLAEGTPASGYALYVTTNPVQVGVATGTMVSGNHFQVGRSTFLVTSNGHIGSLDAVAASAPSLSACGSSTLVGNDIRGLITVAGGPLSTCTVTFRYAYRTAPYCVVTTSAFGSPAAPAFASSFATTSFAVLFSTPIGNGGEIRYICME